MSSATILLASIVVGTTLLLGGCSNEPQLGAVAGIISLEGKPLGSAVVVFEPQGAPASRGVTDEHGRYELTYLADRKGARLGGHRVRIFTGSEAAESDPLARYRTGEELSAEVTAGSNTIDFDLQLAPR